MVPDSAVSYVIGNGDNPRPWTTPDHQEVYRSSSPMNYFLRKPAISRNMHKVEYKASIGEFDILSMVKSNIHCSTLCRCHLPRNLLSSAIRDIATKVNPN